MPPPPRSAHMRSGCEASVTSRTSPPAVTSWTPVRLSAARPCVDMSQPRPPPSVYPAIPVLEIAPPVTARPLTAASRFSSAHVTPPCARTVPACASTWMPFMCERSTTRPSSQTQRPATLWPPPRTAISRPLSRPKRTAAATSAVPLHWAMSAGRRSIRPLCTLRAASYPSSDGSSSVPPNCAASACIRSPSSVVETVIVTSCGKLVRCCLDVLRAQILPDRVAVRGPHAALRGRPVGVGRPRDSRAVRPGVPAGCAEPGSSGALRRSGRG